MSTLPMEIVNIIIMKIAHSKSYHFASTHRLIKLDLRQILRPTLLSYNKGYDSFFDIFKELRVIARISHVNGYLNELTGKWESVERDEYKIICIQTFAERDEYIIIGSKRFIDIY